MLSENEIEKKLLPVLRRQDDLNNYIASVITSGISNEHGNNEYKEDIKKIKKRIQKDLLEDIDDFYAILFSIALYLYNDSKDFYKYNNKKFVKMANNKPVMAIVNTTSSQLTNKHIDRMDLNNMVIKSKDGTKMKVASWYKSSLNVVNTSNNKDFDKNRKINTVAESGIKEVQENGNTSQLDTAVERDINDTITNMSQQIQDEIGKQFGADGVELSVHAFPAEDHAPVQGHVFYNAEYEKLQNGEDFEDVDGNQFTGFERAIGMWNCRHFAFSIVVGVHPRNYTQKQLNDILKKNNQGYSYKGKHITMYQCTQTQRRYEREIRKAKNGYIAAKAGNDKELMAKYQNKVSRYTNEYKAFSKGCGLGMKYDRIYVAGYKT